MKKSQVVATLAAASVMGVVAPLATTANALTVNYDQNGAASGEAECWELNKVKENIAKDSQYQWFVSRDAIVAKYGNIANPGKEYTDITSGAQYLNAFNTLPATALTGQEAVNFNAAINGLKDSVYAVHTNGTPVTTDDINVNSIKFVKDAGALIENNSYRVAFGNLIKALDSGDGVIAAINSFRASGMPQAMAMTGALKADGSAFSATDLNNPNEFANIYTAANLDLVYGTNTVSFFRGLNNALDTLKPELAAAEAGKAAFESLLNVSGVLSATPAGTSAYDTYVAQDKDTNPTVVYNLKTLAITPANFTTEMQAWDGLYTDLTTNAANFTCTDNSVKTDIFDDIWDLASQYKAGEGRTSENTEVVARGLIGGTIVTPLDPVEDDKKPGSDDKKPGTDDKKPSTEQPGNSAAGVAINQNGGKGGSNKNGAPNTGVMISEGTNAASTSTLSALIATIALAGAGLTIFRRSKKNA